MHSTDPTPQKDAQSKIVHATRLPPGDMSWIIHNIQIIEIIQIKHIIQIIQIIEIIQNIQIMQIILITQIIPIIQIIHIIQIIQITQIIQIKYLFICPERSRDLQNFTRETEKRTCQR